MDELERLSKSPVAKNLFGWKLAICQHPMYLLIDEDRGEPVVGERVPPWGAPDAASYVERVERNLDSLDKHPDLRLNYEFSAVEMDALFRDFPSTIERMAENYRQHKLDFIGGTFSQPHLQVVGSESNFRQFELGLETFRRLFGKHVKVYFTQETGMHQQLPQLLKKFKFDFMLPSPFSWAMEIVDGSFEVTGNFKGLSTCENDEFVDAVALDGTSLPAYLRILDGFMSGASYQYVLDEIAKDMPRSPTLWTQFPDMMEIHDDQYQSLADMFDFVLLENSLRERLANAPARAKAKMYTYWSYCEGVWAESLLRANKRSEENAVLAEAALALAKRGEQRDNLNNIWKTILKYQHHDVAWIEVTDLRRKAVDALAETDHLCAEIVNESLKPLITENSKSVAVFNALPHKRRTLVELPGSQVPDTLSPFQSYNDRCLGFVDLPALGIGSFPASKDAAATSVQIKQPASIKTKYYLAKITSDGLIAELRTAKGKSILKAKEYAGGEIRALINDIVVNNRSAACVWHDGPLATIVERKGSLGDIPFAQRYFFFKNEPVIKSEMEFNFNGNKIGYFWLDETKINVYYPATGNEIWHDIPFGYVKTRECRSIFATNWVANGGLVLVNRGTPKHWVKNGVLANVLAWGGNSFSNRLHYDWSHKNQYDLNLFGKQTITHYMLPLDAFDGNKIVRSVTDLTFPVSTCQGAGSKRLLELKDTTLAITSIYEKQGTIRARGYQLPCKGKGKFKDWEIFDEAAKKL